MTTYSKSSRLLRYRRRGFTLVELLVVLGLIALLASLLLPAVQRVKSVANRSTCAAHLGQLGMAFLQYANDNDRRLPDTEDKLDPDTDDWLNWMRGPQQLDKSAIAKYLANGHLDPDLLRCPADPDPEKRAVTWAAPYPYSYAFNGQLFLMGITQIQKPGQKALLVDVELADNTRYYYWVTGGGIVERLSERHMPKWNPQSVYDMSIQPGQRKGSANVLFADFHVGMMETSHENDPEYWAAFPGQPNYAR